MAALFLSACLASSAELENRKVVGGIAALDEIGRIHITNLLLSHRIKPLVIEGGLLKFTVPLPQAPTATALLRRDCRERGYRIWIADTNEGVGSDGDFRTLVTRSEITSVLTKPSFEPTAQLGRFLRSADISHQTVAFPFVVSLSVRARQYLATPTRLRTGFDIQLELQKSASDDGGRFGGTYQVHEGGNRINSSVSMRALSPIPNDGNA
jgi:hypothetical protein